MKFKNLLIGLMLSGMSCSPQVSVNMEEKTKQTNNPLLCDPEKGFCEIPLPKGTKEEAYQSHQKKPVGLIYFTDPICSSCWGIEPQLRKLKLEYGNSIEVEYRMGGLLPDWSYNSGGISKPSDVAHHWDEVSKYYDMPIDGDVWLEDPLSSSYPPSVAFKAAQLQDELKAVKFLRKIREMVFLEKKNISKWEHLNKAAAEVGLDTIKLKADYETKASVLFKADLELAGKLGVRGFPTLFFVDTLNTQLLVYGFKPYSDLEEAVLKTYSKAVKKMYDTSWESLFTVYPTLTTREFSELSGRTKKDSETLLEKLLAEGTLRKMATKNGALWIVKKLH